MKYFGKITDPKDLITKEFGEKMAPLSLGTTTEVLTEEQQKHAHTFLGTIPLSFELPNGSVATYAVVCHLTDITTTVVDDDPVSGRSKEIEVVNPSGEPIKILFSTPEVTAGDSIEYLIEQTDESMSVAYRIVGTEEWTTMPVLTSDDAIKVGDNAIQIVSANIEQSGSTVHLS